MNLQDFSVIFSGKIKGSFSLLFPAENNIVNKNQFTENEDLLK